jgi:hypothetical protein
MDENIFSIYQPMPFEEERFDDVEILQLFKDESFRLVHMQGTLFEKSRNTHTTMEWLNSIEPNHSLYFFYLIDLIRITQAALNHIYSPKISSKRWSDIEHRITMYNTKLDVWLSKVPSAFQFNDAGPPLRTQSSFLQGRVSLALRYYSARITVCRPCMTSLSRHHSEPQGHITQFRDETALTCVQSALSLVAILPEDPDPRWLFWAAPWWSALHYVMQANIIILLYLSAKSSPENKRIGERIDVTMPTVLAAVKKSMRWLHSLAMTSVAARRAYEFCDNFVQRIAPKVGMDIRDVPSVTSLPPLSVAFPEEHQFHHPWSTTTVERDTVPGVRPPPEIWDRSRTLGRHNPSLLSSDNNSHLRSHATHSSSAPPHPVRTSEFDYNTVMDARPPLYDSYSEEYMNSLFPAAGGDFNESESAWPPGGDGDDTI